MEIGREENVYRKRETLYKSQEAKDSMGQFRFGKSMSGESVKRLERQALSVS